MKNNISLHDKERIILGTLISANKIIIDSKQIFESVQQSAYSKLNNYQTLFESVSPEITEYPNAVKYNGNLYAYCQKVKTFIDSFVDKSLYESFEYMHGNLFKEQLNAVINFLEKQDQTYTYSNQVLKIKTTLGQPLFVCGYNLTSIDNLISNIFDGNHRRQDFIAVCYERVGKQIYLISKNNVYIYDIKTEDVKQLNKSVKPENWRAEFLTPSMVCIWENTNLVGLKYTDNLYHDKIYLESLNNKQNKIVVL